MVMLRYKKLPSERTNENPYDSDLDEFPWFLNFLETLSQIRNQPKIWEAFVNWSSLSNDEAFNAVSYGTFPYINVKGNLFGSAHDYGHFKPSMPNDIWIRRDKVQTYEKTQDPGEEWRTAKYLEKLILHELVHWGRHASGVGDDFEVNNSDSGDLFEADAYNDPDNPQNG
jgi:hypothetical protein